MDERWSFFAEEPIRDLGWTRPHREMPAWQRAMELAVACYRLCEQFPQPEASALSTEIVQSAAAVPTAIATGQDEAAAGAYRQQLSVARGKLARLSALLDIAERLDLTTERDTAPVRRQIERLYELVATLHDRLGGVA
ncbi:MAG TPA: four helix bundle protein [Dehalococcoidia bacterium]|nr:four helix bundle protein [Dehalococcoidia bacterium]